MAFLDAKSVFNVMSHNSMMRKLYNTGVDGVEQTRFHSFLVRQSGFRFAHFSIIVLLLLQVSSTDKAGEIGNLIPGSGVADDLSNCSKFTII